MSYNTQFTDVSLISTMTGETIDDSSDPTDTQVLKWIEEVEMEMIAKGYYQEALTGVIMDVKEGDLRAKEPYASWFYDNSSFSKSGLIVPLPNTPFISVANVQRNLAGYTQTANWDDLTEGPADGSHFLIIKKQYSSGLRGVALYFYSNAPAIGFQKLKLDYIWGYDLPATVLREYATSRVSIMLLYSKYMRKEPILNLDVAGLKSSLNKFTDVHIYILGRIEQIEEEWLPNQYTGVGLIF